MIMTQSDTVPFLVSFRFSQPTFPEERWQEVYWRLVFLFLGVG